MSNDEPKVSPSVMKAAEEVADYFDERGFKADRSGKLQEYPDGRICLSSIAQIINTTTHLSEKEKALKKCHVFFDDFINREQDEIDISDAQSQAAKLMTKVWEALDA